MAGVEIYKDELFQQEDEFNLKRWLFRILRAWYWFAASLFICLLVAWLYLHYTNPVYQAVASVIIKDEQKGGNATESALLKDLGIGGNKLVENEIEIFKSYDLMEDVVRRQQLFVHAWVEGRLRDVPLFGNDLPFAMEVLNADSISSVSQWSVAFNKGKLTLTANNKQAVSNLQYGENYSVDGIRFRIMPNEEWREQHKSDTAALNKAFNLTIMPIAAATGGYNGRLSVASVSKQSSVINLTISDPHREKARVILASLIDIYNKQGLDDKNRVTANTIDFLNERLKAVASDLQSVEGEVQQFKSNNQITDVSAEAQQYMEMAKGIDMQKAESQTRLNIVSALERELLLNQNNPGLVPSTLGLEESSLTSLVEKHNSLILEKERIQKNKEIGPENPLLVDLKQQVQETRAKLLANVRNLKSAYEIALGDISRKDDQLKSRIRNVPQIERRLVEIQRNRNVEEQLYAFLLQKREEAAVTLASNIPDSRTIVKARGLGQVSPKSKSIWAVALLLGLLAPLIVMLIIDFLNNKVGDENEVEQKTRVPLLGMISHIRKINSPIVISEKSRSVVAEQVRTLRTAIGFTGKGKGVKKILVTSSQPGDGKSFISINLAASFALLGKKTVLVELDLRKPHVAKYLGISTTGGISGILAGKVKLDETIVEIPGFEHQLYLLPAGYLPPNPAELISTVQMEKLISDLERQFDYIIVDTPPFGLVTDAVLLQKYMDITLAVLRQGHTHKEVYENLNQRASQNPDYPLYAILNGVGWRRRYQKGYGYGRYGSYSYGKGYFEEEKK